MTHLNHEERITLSQCFNLAHKELISDEILKDLSEEGQTGYLIDRTIKLFEIKNQIPKKLKQVNNNATTKLYRSR